MATLVTRGDRLITSAGRESWLARPSVPLSNYGGGSVDLAGRVSSYQTIYETQPWVGVLVNKLARQVSRLPMVAFESRDDGELVRAAASHSLQRVLGRHRRGPSGLRQKMAHPVLVQGNSLLAKFRESAGAPPAELLGVDWRTLIAHRDDETGDVLAWEITHPARRFLAPDEVVHFAFEAGTGQLGISPLKHLGTTLRIEDAAQRYQSSSLENGARPSGALVLPPDSKLDAEKRAELRAEINATHGGVDKAFKLALLSGGLDWKPFSHSAVEAELIDQRRLNREEVAAVYDVPPPLVGILDHATYSNVAEMHRMLFTSVLGPWLTLIEDTLKAQLIDPEPAWEGMVVRFDLTEVLRGDPLKDMQAVATGIQNSVLTPDEGRQRIGLNKVGGPAGQLYMAENNMAPLGTRRASDLDGADETVKSHIARAAERTAKAFDRDRFVRELAVDLGDETKATEAADLVEQTLDGISEPAAARAALLDL